MEGSEGSNSVRSHSLLESSSTNSSSSISSLAGIDSLSASSTQSTMHLRPRRRWRARRRARTRNVLARYLVVVLTTIITIFGILVDNLASSPLDDALSDAAGGVLRRDYGQSHWFLLHGSGGKKLFHVWMKIGICVTSVFQKLSWTRLFREERNTHGSKLLQIMSHVL